MVSGTDYTVTNVGNTNWATIGWTAPVVVGSSATYNGLPITGTTGYATLASNYGKYIAWYPKNLLYGLGLPQTSIPASAVPKNQMNSVWALVKFNNDLLVQGYLAITIETYAYQYNSNTSNAFTGRYSYSFPGSAIVGGSVSLFNATGGTAPAITVPRAVGGFTYLLYCEDHTPKMLPNNGTNAFQVSNGMFASQATTANTLRDPFDLYPEYPHFPLNTVSYTENAIQPTYGGSNVYADQASVEVATIYIKTTSSPNSPQNLQPNFDFQVLAMGYRGSNANGIQAQNYTLQV
jgi:hypothetical protein